MAPMMCPTTLPWNTSYASAVRSLLASVTYLKTLLISSKTSKVAITKRIMDESMLETTASSTTNRLFQRNFSKPCSIDFLTRSLMVSPLRPQQSFGGVQHHAPGNELLHTGQQAVAPSGHDERPPAIQCGERLRHYLIRRLLVAGRPIGFGARGCIKVGGSPARAAGLNDHPVPPGFEVQAGSQAHHEGFRRSVQGEIGQRQQAGDRRDIDDGAF